MVTGHICDPEIVREFYFHAMFEESDEVTSFVSNIVGKVRGIQFRITPKTIQSIYKCPMIADSVMDDPRACAYSFVEIISQLTGVKCVWGGYPDVSASYLTPDN